MRLHLLFHMCFFLCVHCLSILYCAPCLSISLCHGRLPGSTFLPARLSEILPAGIEVDPLCLSIGTLSADLHNTRIHGMQLIWSLNGSMCTWLSCRGLPHEKRQRANARFASTSLDPAAGTSYFSHANTLSATVVSPSGWDHTTPAQFAGGSSQSRTLS